MADLLRPGEDVERYRVERKLGAGGMAEVYLVEHQTLHTRHALKVLTLSGPSLQDRLVAEGRVQARLDHPNLVHVSDVLTIKGLPALVMDYVDGPDLNHWIRLVRPDPVVAEQIFRQLVAGVAAAHAAGVVHRDLKPGNVFMATDADGGLVPKIGDFGLVKAMSTDVPGHTRAGLPMGTPQYMPPEQIRDAATVDQRADVFALGCVLYELLAHEQAYGGHDLIEIFGKVSEGQRDPLPDRIPKRLAALVDWCLEIEPSARPQDCAAILRGLDGDIPSLKAVPPKPTLVPLVLAAGLGSVAVLALLVLAIVAITSGGGSALLPTLTPALEPCPTEGKLGWVRVPTVFEKPPGSTWTLREPAVVLKVIPADPVKAGTEVCVLPTGAQILVGQRVVGEIATWLSVSADQVDQHPAGVAEEPEGEVAAGACRGEVGARLGWFHTRPSSAFKAPKSGGTWHLEHARYVFADYPHGDQPQGAVVCAIPSDASVDVVGDPVGGPFTKGYWVPVVGGSIRAR